MRRNRELELKMFYQTLTARMPQSACTAVTPSLPTATKWCRVVCCWMTSFAAYGVRRTPYNALSVGMTQQFFVFCPLWPWSLTF